MDFRFILVLGFVFLNLIIFGMGAKNSMLSQAEAEYRYVLDDQMVGNSSVFFEHNNSGGYGCFGPFYNVSKIHEQIAWFRTKSLFARVGKIEIDNTEKEFFVINNVFSPEEAQIVDKELTLMGVSYFTVRFEGGYKLYLDFQDVEIDSREVSETRLEAVKSMGRKLERIKINGPQTLYLLILEGVNEGKEILGREKRCQGIA